MNMKPIHLLIFICLAAFFSKTHAEPDYVGSTQCSNCHNKEFSNWSSSHHKNAMSALDGQNLPHFDGKEIHFQNRTIAFYQKNGAHYLTEQIDGLPTKQFRVLFSLGFYPLQQYVIDTGKGHMQMLDIAWDTRQQSEGGQRWFMVDINQNNQSLSWHGSLMNWNSRCASCHTTNFVRNYDANTEVYQSSWSEVAVGCESCHGAASEHIKWTDAQDPNLPFKGFIKAFTSKGLWNNSGKLPTPISVTVQNRETTSELETCFNCHARRQLLKDESNTYPFSKTATIRLLEPDLYFPDGQVKDEVFVAGSYLQSKMHRANVTCSNCHDPHSNQLIQQGNAICTQCHNTERYNTKSHHHHDNNIGSQCINCHMPTRTYMGVDVRRDHAFQKPDPILSQNLDTPNLCLQCHTTANDEEWLKKTVGRWWPQLLSGDSVRARTSSALADLWSSQPSRNWQSEIKTLIQENSSPYVQSSIAYSAPQALNLDDRLRMLADPDELIQTAGLNLTTNIPPAQIINSALPLLRSKSLKTRIHAYRALQPYGLTAENLPEYRVYLTNVEREYVDALQLNADTPMGMVEYANYHLMQNRVADAIRLLKAALDKEPELLIASINLSDIYRQTKEDAAGITVLQNALKYNNDNHLLYYSLGLTYIRLKEAEKAIWHLSKAFVLSNQQLEFGATLAVALHSFGMKEPAKELIDELIRSHPQTRKLYQIKESIQ